MDILQRLALLEAAERDDHLAALALQRGDPFPSPTRAQIEMRRVSFAELLTKYMVADGAVKQTLIQPEAGPSRLIFTSRPKKEAQVSVECVVCCDTFEDFACLNGPCGHFICRQCVNLMAEVASNNEDLFPLQCCQKQLPVDIVLSFLPGPLRATFTSKCAEATTPPHYRIYCPNKRCSNFIGRRPSSTPCIMSCADCNTDVCSNCKRKAHPTESCEDNENREVYSLVNEKGWKQCPKCNMIVERAGGCRHMQCRCHQEFCYGCGKKWMWCRCR